MKGFCRDTRHLAPAAAREVWVEARILRAAITVAGVGGVGWSVSGYLFEPEAGQSAAARRLSRYRGMGAGGRAGREYFRESEKALAKEMLRTLMSVARSDPEFRALVGPEAHAERRRVWSV